MFKFKQEIERLDLPQGEYAVFGSGPLAARGLREAHDADIIVKSGLWQRLTQAYNDNLDAGRPPIILGNIEIWPHWFEMTDKIDEMIESAEIIQGLPFVRLDYVLDWKQAMGRDKDKRDVELINEFLYYFN